MNVATIKKYDIANGVGVRVSLFVSGCRHACPGCFNQVAWNFGYGTPYTQATEQELLDALRPSYIRGLTLRARESGDAGSTPHPRAAGAAGEGHLVLLRVHL